MKTLTLLSLFALPLSVSQGANTIYRNAVLADNPVAYWEFDELVGSTAVDSANSNDATFTGSLGLGSASGAANLGTAIDFTGGYVDIPNLGTFAQSTVETWIQLDAVNAGCCTAILATDTFAIGDLHLNVAGTVFEYAVSGDPTGGAGFIDTTTALSTGTWYHLAVTNDNVADQTKYYINGVEVPDTGDNTLSDVIFNDMRIGSWAGGGRELDGRIDEFAIYDSVLTGTQVANHFAAASIPEPTSALFLLGGFALTVARRRR